MAKVLKIAVIGAGYAGITSALCLKEAGVDVSLFESNEIPGGRARRVHHDTPMPEDNGQHLCLGAYHRLLHYQQKLGLDLHDLYLRQPLTLIDHQGRGFKAPRLPAPLHWIGFFLSHPDAGVKDTLQLFRLLWRLHRQDWRLHKDQALKHFLEQSSLATCHRELFTDLCLAALNTDAAIASTNTFLSILKELSGAKRAASDLLLPRVDLSSLYPLPAIEWLKARGTPVFLGTRVTDLQAQASGITLTSQKVSQVFDGVIIATHARGAIPLLKKNADDLVMDLLNLPHERIATLTLHFSEPVSLPFPMIKGQGAVDWLFDRRALSKLPGPGWVTAVVSAIDQADLDRIQAETLISLQSAAFPTHAHLIHEKLATVSCISGRIIPGIRTHDPRIVLTGDYTHPTLPSTLEGAVRAGETSALTLLKDISDYDRPSRQA